VNKRVKGTLQSNTNAKAVPKLLTIKRSRRGNKHCPAGKRPKRGHVKGIVIQEYKHSEGGGMETGSRPEKNIWFLLRRQKTSGSQSCFKAGQEGRKNGSKTVESKSTRLRKTSHMGKSVQGERGDRVLAQSSKGQANHTNSRY